MKIEMKMTGKNDNVTSRVAKIRLGGDFKGNISQIKGKTCHET